MCSSDLPGWDEDISSVRDEALLPEATRAYVKRLEELVGSQIGRASCRERV